MKIMSFKNLSFRPINLVVIARGVNHSENYVGPLNYLDLDYLDWFIPRHFTLHNFPTLYSIRLVYSAQEVNWKATVQTKSIASIS